MNLIKLTKEELNEIQTVLNRFADADSLSIARDGEKLDILFNTTVNGISGVFKVTLTEPKI